MKFGAVLGLISLFSLSSCYIENNLTSRIFCFDTSIEITLNEGSKTNLKEIENIFKTYSNISDNYLNTSVTNVYNINESNDDIEVSKELYDLLKYSFSYIDTLSLYNPLCGSLSKRWKESLAKKEVLSNDIISEELEKMNNTYILFKENNIVQRVGEAEIDLGGIAKGYALDVVHRYLKKNNITKYLINAGSSSVLLGKKKNPYLVGIEKLDNAYFELSDKVISTSSIYKQGVTIDGVTYSHIINPFTGSAVNEHDAVIVINDEGALGDILSTSLMMSSLEEIKSLEEQYDFKSIVIDNKSIVYHHKDIEVKTH